MHPTVLNLLLAAERSAETARRTARDKPPSARVPARRRRRRRTIAVAVAVVAATMGVGAADAGGRAVAISGEQLDDGARTRVQPHV
jgi:hypothetical protein